MNIKAILFDMDGVLVDSFEAWYQLFRATLKHFGKNSITRPEFIQHAWAQGLAPVSRRYFVDRQVEEIAEYYSAHFLDYKNYLKVIDGATQVLPQIKQRGLELAVISNTYTQLTHKILKQVALLDYFHLIIGGDKVKNNKPAPDMVLLACKQLGVKTWEAIVVGDTRYDIAAAREAGCLALGYKIAGDVRINSLGELLKFIA